MALLYHFVTVPPLPKDVQHQSGTVEIVRYLVPEDHDVEADTAILTVRNWWAEMEVLAGISGHLVTTIFKSFWCEGGQIRVGEPIALLVVDPLYRSDIDEQSRLRIVRRLRQRDGTKQA